MQSSSHSRSLAIGTGAIRCGEAPLRWFEAHYRLASVVKRALLPEWLADSLNDRFDADLGLMQTTRLPVHQTKVRLIAAAIDAIEQADNTTIELAGMDPTADGAWSRPLCRAAPTGLARSWARRAAEPCQRLRAVCRGCLANRPSCNVRSPSTGRRSLKRGESSCCPISALLVPSLVLVREPTQLAFQLMAFAGKQFYVKGQPTSSRPLAQAVAIDLPGRPAWRLRHEVETTLGWLPFARDQLGLRGDDHVRVAPSLCRR